MVYYGKYIADFSFNMALKNTFCSTVPSSSLSLSVPEPVFVEPEVTLPRWISAKRFHLRTVLWRAGMQALVFHQNANNIICNIQGNIIVVLIGEKNC